MLSKINKIAVIGTGVIGIGWIIRMLAHNKMVIAFDLNIKQKTILVKEIKRSLPFVKKLFKKKKINLKNLSFKTSLIETLKDADFIQECATENYKLKTKLMSDIGKYSKPNTIISSSSSGLLPSIIFSKCKNPNRGIIGHPFNPVYMLPAVEIVPGKKTSKIVLKKANNFYRSISMNPISVKKELPGYLADRLQEALWREGLHIINEGYATTEDLDRAIEDGPGLRWSLMGTFLTFHLAGGKAGMKHMLEQFGPALKLPWTKLKAPNLSNRLIKRLVEGTKKQSKGKSVVKISNIRDKYLLDLLLMRKKYEKKLR
ncbi:3-hydroxyacyl-CoA dehydrogenase NAD-binding domain-containing protein [Candidatus Pelagibacter sp.]|nr:3-hydroxyacyl-CoA dehydrogenase NAD-binding domain-containing protein [Candidatus Pelagibacter sp.]MDC0855570.1 3-hydroxyacyl-CoA dehydrogenase NAD-binding domain-containing protein [Candidatus Pelagibacter sp.]